MNKKSKLFIISFGSTFLSLLLVFVYLCQSTILTLSSKNPSNSYSNVLKRANDSNKNFGNSSFTNIALLGAHDAFSYEIKYTSKPNINQTTHIANNKFLYNVGRGAFVRLAKAQKHDAYTQLQNGVRLLDARITCINNEFYTSHGLISHYLKNSLIDVLTFLNENPGEFIIFYILNYYPGQSNETELFDYISSIKINNKNLFDYVNYDYLNETSANNITYNDLTENGNKAGAFIYYKQKENTKYSDYFKLSNAYSNHWSLLKSEEKLNEINTFINELPEDFDGIRINQTQLAPNEDRIFDSIVAWSLLDMGEDCNAYLVDNENFDYWLDKLPIYLCDYSTSTKNDFNRKVNEQILKHNINLSK